MEEQNTPRYMYICNNSISRELCNDLINLFEQEQDTYCKYKGITAQGVNVNIKDTTDLRIDHTNKNPIYDIYTSFLSKELYFHLKKYVKKFDFIDNDNNMLYPIRSGKNVVTECMQIQKYEKNVGKYVYHNDFNADFNNNRYRVLTFLWYLNDIDDGGETEFFNDFRIKPKAGKLILFPASWTFPHKGRIPISDNKYIITGWLWHMLKE